MSMVNIRCFDIFGPIFPASINIFIGKNNSGKSTLLKAIYSIQNRQVIDAYDVTIGCEGSESKIYFNVDELAYENRQIQRIVVDPREKQSIFLSINDKKRLFKDFESTLDFEPNSIIYPCFTSRISNNLETSVGEEAAKEITDDNKFLTAKVDSLISKHYKSSSKFREYCNYLFGFDIATKSKGEGKQVVRYIDDDTHISISSMGDGISSLLKVITYLCTVKNKVILIEEPENDLHPTLLKKFLEILVKEASLGNNQIFVTTHSNIVLRILGSQPDSKIFKISKNTPGEVMSKVEEISQTDTNQRFQILNELGYHFSDFGLWKGWLILEESTAEKIIRDYLIPWYTPCLSDKLKTIASKGKNDVKKRIKALMDLFVFIHLESIYKNNAWILIDDGEDEKNIIEELKTDFSSWSSDQFMNLSKHDFEAYYPDRFSEDISALNSLHHDEKYKPKIKLLNKVINWIEEDNVQAKKEFAVSAKDVIKILKMIESKLCQ